MLWRVSANLTNDDMQFWNLRRERDMASAETKMARQSKIENLRDDPLAAARAVRFDSVGTRLERYEKNATWAQDQYKISEDYVRQSLDITQRLREIAVQGANGTYTKEDMKYMGQEVDQLVGEMVSLANSRGSDGNYLFSGDKSRTEPFRQITGAAPGASGEVLTQVQYLGERGGPSAEISEGEYMPLTQNGSEIFWAERQQVVSSYDARDWRASRDSSIIVDGKSVDIKAGDNVYAVAAKINDSGASVKASIDPRTFSLSVETTTAHQLWMEDGPLGAASTAAVSGPGAPASPASGTVLKELGLLSQTSRAPDNWAPSARVSGGSLFDVAIRLRDSLNKGDILETGGSAIAGIDAGIDNLNRRIGELGARSERIQSASARLNREIPDNTKLTANETDLDVTQAVTDYKMLEMAQKASLSFMGRLFPQTLLDFLR